METSELTTAGQCSSDWEMFQRVWRRVVPEERDGQPITLVPSSHYQGGIQCPPASPPALLPSPIEEDKIVTLVEESSWNLSESYLGASSRRYGGDLQGFLIQELLDYKTYQSLSRKLSGQPARTLAVLSSQNRNHAKRLSTAYFLLSGVRYWPEGQTHGNLNGGNLQTLRRQFVRAQRRAMDYRTAEASTHDGYIKELYLSLAEVADAHTWHLRDVLEQI